MNMIMHGREDAEIAQGDVIGEPQFKASETHIQTFDFVVANPPFSAKAWGSGLTSRHEVRSVRPRDAARQERRLRLPPAHPRVHEGHRLRRGDPAARRALPRQQGGGAAREDPRSAATSKAIIGLPANLFYGTGIPASIIVLDKSEACAERPVFMIDASRGFTKDGHKNRLRERDIHKITDAYTRQDDEIPGYARLVPYAEIARNDFNLNIPRYIDGSDPEDLQDIEAHLKGGVPNRDIDLLAEFWDVMPGVRATLVRAEPAPGLLRPAGRAGGGPHDHPQPSRVRRFPRPRPWHPRRLGRGECVD